MANYKEMDRPNSNSHKLYFVFSVIATTASILTFCFFLVHTTVELKECGVNNRILMAQLKQLRDAQVTTPATPETLPPSVTASPLLDLGTLTKNEALECNCGDIHAHGSCAKLYQDWEYKGATTCINDLKKEKSCQNLSEWWQDRQSSTARVSSLKTIGCVRLWAEMDCHGASIQIQPGTKGTANLTLFNFNDKTRSIRICDIL